MVLKMIKDDDMDVIDLKGAVVEDDFPNEPIEVTDSSFNEQTQKYPLIVVDCWAEWCSPCRMIAPVLEELAKDYAGKIVFAKLNVDENHTTATKYGIMSIPTLLIMKDGQEVDRLIGAAPKEYIEDGLKKHLE
jgi:thioredoxin 1